MKKPKICVVGPGVVGKATLRAFRDKGLETAFIARTQESVDKLRSEGFTAYGRNDLMNGDYDYDITIFTLPTPTNNKKINLDAMELAAIDLGKRLRKTNKYHVVVVKSTCPPGTTENVVVKTIEEFSGKKVGVDFGACMNPEYLREVSAYEDTVKPWVIVIGEHDKKSGDLLASAYKNFDAPIYRCSMKEAEMQKYVHNLYNAVKITFFNEMREIANNIDVDANKIFEYTVQSCEGIWNPKYGTKDRGAFSGACLPKDTKAFLHFVKGAGLEADLLKKTIEVNEKIKLNSASMLTSFKADGKVTNGNADAKLRFAELLREEEMNTN